MTDVITAKEAATMFDPEILVEGALEEIFPAIENAARLGYKELVIKSEDTHFKKSEGNGELSETSTLLKMQLEELGYVVYTRYVGYITDDKLDFIITW